MICYPQPPGCSQHIDRIGGLQIPRLIGRTFFTTDNISVGTPNGVGRLAEDSPMHLRSAGYVLSSVRCSGGFAIRRQKLT